MRRRAIPFLICLFVALAVATAASAWVRPVDAPITDNWRAPANKYGAGNRGVDFATTADTPVKVAGDGVVTFAGQVGGTLYVVVSHEGGLRTTYGNLSSIAIGVNDRVNAGDAVGNASEHLHFGVRSGDEYIDPNSLYGKPVLVPER